MTNIAKKYGPIFSVYVGNDLTIVLNDYPSLRKAFVEQSEVFSGRPVHGLSKTNPNDEKMLIMRDGPFWKDHRRFALTTLKDFGVGKSSIEPKLQDELQYFLREVEKKEPRTVRH